MSFSNNQQFEVPLLGRSTNQIIESLKKIYELKLKLAGYFTRSGLPADIIAVEGDPTSAISVIRKVKLVMKDGKICN